jgi:hypothetical protein
MNYNFDKFMVKELNLWKNGGGRFQRVASVAWVISRANLKGELKGLYDEIVERIDNDEWYVDFYESVNAL